jgi:hypothetical protein
MDGIVALPLIIVGVLIVLFIASALLRAAVALANATIGRVRPSASVLWDWEAGADEDDDDSDRPRRGTLAMPEPGIGQGMAIVFLAALVQLVATVGVRVLFDIDFEDDLTDLGKVLFIGFSVLVGFGMTTTMAASMLPTTGRRAALAAAYFYLICLAIAAVVGVLMAAVFGR